MQLAFTHYPELQDKYRFAIPASYNYRALATHQMPPELFALFTTALKELSPQLSSGGQHE